MFRKFVKYNLFAWGFTSTNDQVHIAEIIRQVQMAADFFKSALKYESGPEKMQLYYVLNH